MQKRNLKRGETANATASTATKEHSRLIVFFYTTWLIIWSQVTIPNFYFHSISSLPAFFRSPRRLPSSPGFLFLHKRKLSLILLFYHVESIEMASASPDVDKFVSPLWQVRAGEAVAVDRRGGNGRRGRRQKALTGKLKLLKTRAAT